jgi:hypothetical protein
MTDNPFEIPQALRDASEQNLKQAHAAYEQLMDFMTKAMGASTGALPSDPLAAVLKTVQDRVAAMAKQNAESVFVLVEKIAKAQNFREIVTLQTRFAQDQMQAYATQTQELFSVIGEVVQKSERGTMGASMGTLPSNLMPANLPTTGFNDVQDRALYIARENAESVFAFAGKISNALTPQDIVTLQTQFAQDQMQAFATQTQELQRLMGETLQKLQRG